MNDLDAADTEWINSFIGTSIAEGSTIDGFVSVISWIDPEGEMRWRLYSTIDNAIRSIGLLTAASTALSMEISNPTESEE
jgi:hypothetical protein